MTKGAKKLYLVILCSTILCLLLPICVFADDRRDSVSATENFLAWYEETRNLENNGTSVYHLTEDIFLLNPMQLDGFGNLEIDCGEYRMIIGSEVVIDNPNLTISGSNSSVIVVVAQGNLILANGTLRNQNPNQSTGIVCQYGELSSGGENDCFYIECSGLHAEGIQIITYNDVEELQNLHISVSGETVAKGIVSNTSKLTLANCILDVFGGESAIGAQSEYELSVRECTVTAQTNLADEGAVSLNTIGQGPITVENGENIPPIQQMTPPPDDAKYMVVRVEIDETMSLPQNASVYILPKTVRCQLWDLQAAQYSQVIYDELPIVWDERQLQQMVQSQGQFDLIGHLDVDALQEKQIAPYTDSITMPVYVTGDAGLPVLGISLYSKQPIGMDISIPYPNGANALYLEYTSNGKKWTSFPQEIWTGKPVDETILPNTEGIRFQKEYTWHLDLPNEVSLPITIRHRVDGGAYHGAGVAITIEKDGSTSVPQLEFDENSDGDRGGQQSPSNNKEHNNETETTAPVPKKEKKPPKKQDRPSEQETVQPPTSKSEILPTMVEAPRPVPVGSIKRSKVLFPFRETALENAPAPEVFPVAPYEPSANMDKQEKREIPEIQRQYSQQSKEISSNADRTLEIKEISSKAGMDNEKEQNFSETNRAPLQRSQSMNEVAVEQKPAEYCDEGIPMILSAVCLLAMLGSAWMFSKKLMHNKE